MTKCPTKTLSTSPTTISAKRKKKSEAITKTEMILMTVRRDKTDPSYRGLEV